LQKAQGNYERGEIEMKKGGDAPAKAPDDKAPPGEGGKNSEENNHGIDYVRLRTEQ